MLELFDFVAFCFNIFVLIMHKREIERKRKRFAISESKSNIKEKREMRISWDQHIVSNRFESQFNRIDGMYYLCKKKNITHTNTHFVIFSVQKMKFWNAIRMCCLLVWHGAFSRHRKWSVCNEMKAAIQHRAHHVMHVQQNWNKPTKKKPVNIIH